MRASKRSAARATALYEVREGLVERRPPPDALLAAWSDAIDANVQSPFGVRKLAAFDLAAPLPPHADLPWLDERSLLFYAAWRGRDPIVHSLLRARAEPCAGVTGVAAHVQGLPGGAQYPLLRTWALAVCAGAGGACGDCGGRLAVAKLPCGCARCAVCLWRGVLERRADAIVCCGLEVRDATRPTKAPFRPRALGPGGAAPRGREGAPPPDDGASDGPSSRASSDSSSSSPPAKSAKVETAEDDASSDSSSSSPPAKSAKVETAEDDARNWRCGFCAYGNFARRAACRNCGGERGAAPLVGARTDDADFCADAARRRAAALAPRDRAYARRELAAAVDRGDAHAVRRALRTGADADEADDDGLAPLVRARWRGRDRVVAELRRWGAAEATTAVAACRPRGAAAPAAPAARTALLPGAFYVDGGFAPAELDALDALFDALPVSGKCKAHNARRGFVDVDGWCAAAVGRAVGGVCLPQLRFLDYALGGALAAHVDLARAAPGGGKSTHTVCLYLTDTDGGETVLLRDHHDGDGVAACAPRRGRVFVFPHVVPHRARETRSPKRLLRGDVVFPPAAD